MLFRSGIPVVVKDEAYRLLMEMTLLSLYAMFNEDRREILNAYSA